MKCLFNCVQDGAPKSCFKWYLNRKPIPLNIILFSHQHALELVCPRPGLHQFVSAGWASGKGISAKKSDLLAHANGCFEQFGINCSKIRCMVFWITCCQNPEYKNKHLERLESLMIPCFYSLAEYSFVRCPKLLKLWNAYYSSHYLTIDLVVSWLENPDLITLLEIVLSGCS